MRWDNLFDDLESQLEQELGAEEVDLRAEEERLRLGRLSLRDRLVMLGGADGSDPVRVSLLDGTTLAVQPRTFGRDWISGDVVDESTRHAQCILPLSAIAQLTLSRDQVTASLEDAAEPERGLSRRLGLSFVLRDLCRRRGAVDILVADGVLSGTIDRVGRDHLDLAIHEPGTPRRENEVSHYRLLPFSRVLLVRL